MAPILESNQIVGQKYKVKDQLKHYKELFICVDIETNVELVLKVEPKSEKDSKRLKNEISIYKKLSSNKWFDIKICDFEDDKHRYLLLKPLGDNLYDFWKKKKKRNEWSMESVVRYSDEMVSRVANCHLRDVIHRDIKPENFVVDRNDNNCLYLIDFNLAKEYTTGSTHIPFRVRSPNYSVGNPQFLSVNAHKGEEQSRRDDLISVGYTMVYLAKGSLPWSDLHSRQYSSRFEYIKAVGKEKMNCSVGRLCEGLPLQFKQYMDICLGLGFEETPNYSDIRSLFKQLLHQINSKFPLTLVQCLPDIESDVKAKNIMKCRRNLFNVFQTSPQMKCP